MTCLAKLNENFDNNFSILVLRLSLLVDEDIVDVSVLAALLLYLLLQLVVQLVTAHHVFEAEDPALSHPPRSWNIHIEQGQNVLYLRKVGFSII